MKRHCSPTSPNTGATGIFSDNHHQFLHPNLSYSSPLHLPQHPPPPPLPFPDNLTITATNTTPDPKPNNNNNDDGASIETQRRPRGRPPGSKNKPKSPNPNPTRIISNPNQTDQYNNNHHHILEILNGADVIESIAKYSLRHNTSLRVLHASGAVANVTIRQSNPLSAPTATLHGRFDILSLSALFIGPSTQSQIPIGAFNDVSITLSIPKGHIVGGFVVGPLMASGSVYVLVEAISGLTYHRLDLLEEGGVVERENVNATSSGGGQSPSGGEKNGGSGDCGINLPMFNSSAGFMPY